MTEARPSAARVVIIGGGMVGSRVAYHLTRSGCTDVVLLERRALTSGTTWHAAGLVGQLRSTASQIRIARYALDLYPTLEAETGRPTGFANAAGSTWRGRPSAWWSSNG
ncbi:MAG: FAD-binding oxidoreductase [Gemmatimonadota bacterium]